MTTDKFYMAGTEGTGEYMVVVATSKGRIGYRPLGGDVYRVRVEPANDEAAASLRDALPADRRWKQPGDSGQNRFSTMVYDGLETLKRVLEPVVNALRADATDVEPNLDAPTWVQVMAGYDFGRAEVTTQLRRIGVRGINGRWKIETLYGKLASERSRMVGEIRRRKLPGCNLASTWKTDTLYAKLIVQKRA